MDSLKVVTAEDLNSFCDQDKEIIFIYAQALGRIKRICMNIGVASMQIILMIFYFIQGQYSIELLDAIAPAIKIFADIVMWGFVPLMVVVLLAHPFKSWELLGYLRGNKKVIEHFRELRQFDIRQLTEKQIWNGLFDVEKPFLS